MAKTCLLKDRNIKTINENNQNKYDQELTKGPQMMTGLIEK